MGILLICRNRQDFSQFGIIFVIEVCMVFFFRRPREDRGRLKPRFFQYGL